MDLLQIIILAVVQGLTEFLPISSSAHLILVPVFTDWPDQGLSFDIAVHLGSLGAVLYYFRRELAEMSRDWCRSLQRRQLVGESRLAWAVLLGTIPVGLAGLALKGLVENEWRSPVVIGLSLIGFGLLLAWSDWKHKNGRDEHSLSWKDVAIIGCAQALALIPGTSRSGITMTAALFLGLSREAASRFSFLLSIPVIILAIGLEVLTLLGSDEVVEWGSLLLGTILAGLAAYLCIHYFLAFIRRIGMQPFVVYRLLLGMVLLYLFW
ncbi:undecaprenyl-diphosphate phosphatase [Desulfurivibrio alkaliphilus]|uniref:Undecaprenyl-diphosphatase n=1 Tax=Desulfurivibrio alkaliphilus (strain DSM 19089 / UNIQEM U267 / AHT2) TaxID=589865 RepID=D6Z5N4_DESAT|nr:undecaprenyl-diphosphate phosphatase [Desulfurivibrio alkaliphilus]ADH86771.1 undecaprenol kinase [Desulfurivibrio alkaliphilus AHT 2]